MCQAGDKKRRSPIEQQTILKYLDLGEKVDPDPFGLQTARFLDPHTKVLHVWIDDILHGSAKWQQSFSIITNKTTERHHSKWTSVHCVDCTICHSHTISTQTIWTVLRPYGISNYTVWISPTFELFSINILHKLHVFFETLPECFMCKLWGMWKRDLDDTNMLFCFLCQNIKDWKHWLTEFRTYNDFKEPKSGKWYVVTECDEHSWRSYI